jgi:SlyX protein
MTNDTAPAGRSGAATGAGLEARVETLEIRLTEQQTVIDDLNKVVLDQWKDIAELRRLVERLEARVEEAAAEAGVAAQDEPPPPHY